MKLSDYQENFILHLIRSGAIKFGQFKLKSGRISPYFINMAAAVNDGEGASQVGTAYAKAIMKNISSGFDYIHGPAYKGIPLAALAAEKIWEIYEIKKRWGYDRKETKAYGDITEQMIVGDLRDGDAVLIVDDVVTTGGTKVENWQKIASQKNVRPKGILIAVDREELSQEDKERLEALGLHIYSIIKISEVFKYLSEHKFIDRKIIGEFEKYLNKYKNR